MVDDIQEEWKPVVGFEGYYEISSYGRLRRTAATSRTGKEHFMTPHPNGWGYLSTVLTVNHIGRTVRVHILAAAAFLGPRPGKAHINHIDGNKRNNRIENLEYISHSENSRHAVRMGLWKTQVKLSPSQVVAIRQEAKHSTQTSLAQKYGVGQYQISRIVSGKRWGWLPD